VSLRLCVIKNFGALRHDAISTLPLEPQADEKVLNTMASIRSGKFSWSCPSAT
jgi:hypothetical protein